MPTWRWILALVGSAAVTIAGAIYALSPGHGIALQYAASGPTPQQAFSVSPSQLTKAPLPTVTIGQVVRGTSSRHPCAVTVRSARVIDPNLCIDAPVVTMTRSQAGALNIPTTST